MEKEFLAPALTELLGQGWSLRHLCAGGALWIFWLWGGSVA